MIVGPFVCMRVHACACVHVCTRVYSNVVCVCVAGCFVAVSQGFNVGSAGAKVFSEPKEEEFGYSVQQFSNHMGKW